MTRPAQKNGQKAALNKTAMKALAGMTPVVGTAVKALADLFAARNAERLLLLVQHALGTDVVDDKAVTELSGMLQSDTASVQAMHLAFADDESAKAWIYGSLIRAFARNQVPVDRRLNLVRFAKRAYNDDLEFLLRCGYWAERLETMRNNQDRLCEELGVRLTKAQADALGPILFSEIAGIANGLRNTRRALAAAMDEHGMFRGGNWFSDEFFVELLPILHHSGVVAHKSFDPPFQGDYIAALKEAHRHVS